MPEIALHEASAGHSPASEDGSQMSAHWDGFCEPEVSSTHFGLAVVPAGTFFGHEDRKPHFGEQNEPLRPVIWTAVSPALHGPAFGSS